MCFNIHACDHIGLHASHTQHPSYGCPWTRKKPHLSPPPGLAHHPPTQPVDVTSSTKLNYAEDVNLPDRRRGQHYVSCEENSGFDHHSGHSTSNGGGSPETDEELSMRIQPVKLSTRKLP
jgi:hypothetical protein